MRTFLAAVLAAALAATATWWFGPRRDAAGGGDSPPPEPAPIARSEGRSPPETSPAVLQAENPRLAELRRLESELADAKRRLADAEAEVSRLRGLVGTPGTAAEGIERARLADLVDLGLRVRRRAEELLLTVPSSVTTRHAALLARSDAGAARILPRGKYDALVEKRGGGAYYSFATSDNSCDKEPDIELQQGSYSSSFYGGTWGYVLDLGAADVEHVPDSPTVLPAGLDETSRTTWEFLWRDAGTTKSDVPREFQDEANRLRLRRGRAPAVVGHAYVVRAILPGEHDHLVAFSPVEEDEYGHTLVWRVLKSWPVEKRR
jgi:hypothetical protein